MANLNEDVLRLIFDYLPSPLEWIQVSEVCQLWKSAASKQWRKLSRITLYNPAIPPGTNAPVISQTDLNRIIKCAAPFVSVLNQNYIMIQAKSYETPIVTFGPFSYKVPDFNLRATFLLLAGRTANLKKLSHSLDTISSTDLREILSAILPFVLKLKSLDMYLRFDDRFGKDCSISCEILMDIARFSQLEHLSLSFFKISLTDVDSFVEGLARGCPNLRSIRLCKHYTLFLFTIDLKKVRVNITGKQLCTLLTLPRLEILFVNLVSNFHAADLPEMVHLTELILSFSCENPDTSSFCNVLRKMPNLKELELTIDENIRKEGRDYNDEETVKLVRQVAIVAASQNKKVVLKNPYKNRYSTELRIERKNGASSDKEIETLNLVVSIYDDAKFHDNIKTFLRNNLESHDLVVL